MRKLSVAFIALVLSTSCGRPILTCPASTTLDTLVSCIRDQMPKSGSNGFVAPTAAQRADWQTLVTRMLQGTCEGPLPASLAEIVQVRTFTDSSNGRSYCLLMEVRDRDNNGIVDNGFGTFIVNSAATRELSHQAVHPIADGGTDDQAVALFRDTSSRSFLMAGSHRDANRAASTCRPNHPESDASHNSNTMVQATNEALVAFYGDRPWFAIEWHGMAAATCPRTDVFPSHGRDVVPAVTDTIAVLRQHLSTIHPDWRVDLPGAGACDLAATENVQGRLMNGVAANRVCDTEAASYTQRFVHIEQDPNFRNPRDWLAAVTATFP